MYLKAGLFLVIGFSAAFLIIAENPNWKMLLLLALVIWSFCRAYYFAFYVIEKYIDPTYKFSGVFNALKYILIRKVTR
jgi:hypothetical protein